jgi:uncharacterized alkaline shock family protein YloU
MLHVWRPGSLCLAVGMTNGIARSDSFIAYLTVFCHIYQPSLTLSAKIKAGSILSPCYKNGKVNSLNFRCIFQNRLTMCKKSVRFMSPELKVCETVSGRLNMAVIQQTSFGKIEFSDEFLSNLAGVATMECYGIVGMASQKAIDGIVELLKGENLNKGVEILTTDDSVHIHVYVIVEYGVSISAVASNVIDTVKYRVEKITGLNVEKVDVTVNGIRV